MKKGMKKLTAFILLAVMLLQTLPVIAFATVGAMKLTVSSVNGIAGDTVEVTVDISNNPGIASLVFNVEYDSALTLKGVEFNSAFGPYVTTPPTYTNPQTVTLISPLQDVSVNGTLATFTFEIGANVTDGYEAYVNVSFAEKNIFNSENELVATVAENGKVSVFRGIAGDINSDREVDTRDAILLFRYVAGWDVDVDPFALDCNGDGDVDTKDAITLFRYIAGWPDIKLYYGVTCAHKLTFVESKDASCTENGNVAYWHCSSCGGNYADVNGENKLDTTVVPALGHAMTYNAANSATCTQNGNVEYWHCSNCELNFADENGETVLSKTVITAEGHNLTKISEKAASCTESGNVTYWYCEICKKNFADEDATRELGDVTVSASGHKLSFVEAKEATHIADGNVAYWYCTACKCSFTDESASAEIDDIVIPATGHGEMLEHVEAKAATVYEKGNDEYWYCPECDKYYSDVEAKNELVGGKPEIDVIESYSITFVDTKNWHDIKNIMTILIPKTEGHSVAQFKPDDVLGYNFVGWFTDEGINMNYIPAGTDIVLNAKWDAIEYTITYNDAPTNNNPTTYTIEQEIIISDPEWEALKFAYWTVDSGNVLQSTSNGKTIYKIEKGTIGNIELTANWQSMENLAIPNYTGTPQVIHYDDDTGRYHFVFELGTIENVVIKTIHGRAYKHKNENLDWKIDEGFNYEQSTSEEVGKAISSSIAKSEESQISFEWIQEHQETSTSEISASLGVEDAGVTAELGGKISASITDTESYGMSVSNGTTIELGAGYESSLSSTVAYSKIYSTQIEFNRSVGSGWPAGDYSYVQVGRAKVYVIITYDPLERNYYLDTYSIMAEGDDATKSMIMYTPSADMDVNIIENQGLPCNIPQQYLLDTINNAITIKFDPNKGSGKMNAQLIGKDFESNLLTNEYTRLGYKFLGWSTDPNAIKAEYEDKASVMDLTAENGAIVLYAVWQGSEYEVSYNFGGCGMLLQNPVGNVTYSGNNATLIYNDANMTYTFKNSNNSDPFVSLGHSVNLVKGVTYYIHMDVNNSSTSAVQLFYAIGGAYTEAQSVRMGGTNNTVAFTVPQSGSYNIRIDNDTGTTLVISNFSISEIDTRKVTDVYGTTYDKLPTPTSSNYKFLGWYNGSDKVTSDTKLSTADHHTLKAKWVRISAYWTTGDRGEVVTTDGRTEYWQTGLNRAALKADGYTKFEITIKMDGKFISSDWFKADWWFEIYDPYGNMVVEENEDHWNTSFETREFKYTISLDTIYDDGTIRVWYDHSGDGADDFKLGKLQIWTTAK